MKLTMNVTGLCLCLILSTTATCQEANKNTPSVPLPPEPSALKVESEGPLNLLLIDPQGLRFGFDARGGKVVKEIPGGSFYCCPDSSSQVIDIAELIAGTYTLEGTAYGSGEYALSLEQVSEHLVTLNRQERRGSVTPGQVISLRMAVPFLARIDLKPGDADNVVNPATEPLVPVVIFSEAFFDAPSRIDIKTIRFGQTGEENSLAGDPEARDVNGDGLPDVVCQIRLTLTRLGRDHSRALLKAKLRDGKDILALDIVGWR